MGEFAIGSREVIQDAASMDAAIHRMAARLREIALDEDLGFIGIQRRGIPLAERLRAALGPEAVSRYPLGGMDITLYRDDLSSLGPQPIVGPTRIPFDVTGMTIILVDDVLYTGRTIRAALEALVAYGRPKAVRLAVLVDRGHREYPIQADIIGFTVPTTLRNVVEVNLSEIDGGERIELCTRAEEEAAS